MMSADVIKKYPAEIILCAILCLSAFFNLWNIWNGGFSNAYYAAAVKSTLVNPVAGFFNSLDPAGFITIDKPPVGLWVQAAFAAVLGFSGWALILPQALAGVGSVALIYFIVSRPFGKPAGLVAAFALAVTPVSVAIARNGTMDMQMVFVVLLAVWAALKAARERSLPWLLGAMVLVGIGFNIKMIQAFIVVPAILLVYILATTGFSWKKRILHLGLAVLVLLAVSLSWALVVDIIPADQRPYVGGSDDNTELGLILNYNGAHRLGIGESGNGPGNGSPGSSAGGLDARLSASGPGSGPGSSGSTSAPPGGSLSAGPTGQGSVGGSSGMPSGSPGGMGGGGMNGSNPGILRLFQNDLAGDIGWLLVFALIGVLAWARKPRNLSLKGFEEAGYFGEKGLTLLAMLLWLVPGLLYFSFTSGFWHDYYIATLAPPLAALVGIGAAGMYHEYRSGNRTGWLLVLAIVATGLIQAYFLERVSGPLGAIGPVILVATLGCAGLLALVKVQKTEVLEKHRMHIAAVAIAVVFIAPLAWSCTLLPGGNSGNLPSASPSGGSGGSMGGGGQGGSMFGGSSPSGMAGPGNTGNFGPGGSSTASDDGRMQQADRAGNSTRFSDPRTTGGSGSGAGPSGMSSMGGISGDRTAGGSGMTGGPGSTGGPGESGSTSALADYLLAHTTNETWILAVPSSHQGADLIITTGKPVMCLGGFAGSDQVLNVTTLQEYIHDGKVRFFQTGGEGGGGGSGSGNSELASWVSTHCTAVSLTEGDDSTGIAVNQSSTNGAGSTLYDCLGAA